MVEPEIAFADLNDDMDLAESMLKYIINYVMENAEKDMAFFNSFIDKGLLERLTLVKNSEFERISYTDAIKVLEKVAHQFQYPVYWGCDLQTEHERYLSEKYFSKPVFVTDYPKDIKAFYMRLNDDENSCCTTCLSQVLVRLLGTLRKIDILEQRINEMGLPMEDYYVIRAKKIWRHKACRVWSWFERALM